MGLPLHRYRADVEPGLLALRAVAHADAPALRAHPGVEALAVLLGEVHILQLHVDDRDAVVPECSLAALSADLGEHGAGAVRSGIQRDETGQRTLSDRRAELGEQNVAEPRLRPRAIEYGLEKPSRISDAPDDCARGDNWGFLEREKFTGWAPICEQPAIESVDALIRELKAQSRVGDNLDRLAELGDDDILRGIDRERALAADDNCGDRCRNQGSPPEALGSRPPHVKKSGFKDVRQDAWYRS